jgi:hypothetical protein
MRNKLNISLDTKDPNYRKNNKEYRKLVPRVRSIPEQERKYKLKALYNLTLDDYQKLLDETNGVCPLCGVTLIFDGVFDNSAVIDHNHETGEIRGIMCNSCNRGLGQFKDNIQSLEKAIEWLKKQNRF